MNDGMLGNNNSCGTSSHDSHLGARFLFSITLMALFTAASWCIRVALLVNKGALISDRIPRRI